MGGTGSVAPGQKASRSIHLRAIMEIIARMAGDNERPGRLSRAAEIVRRPSQHDIRHRNLPWPTGRRISQS